MKIEKVKIEEPVVEDQSQGHQELKKWHQVSLISILLNDVIIQKEVNLTKKEKKEDDEDEKEKKEPNELKVKLKMMTMTKEDDDVERNRNQDPIEIQIE